MQIVVADEAKQMGEWTARHAAENLRSALSQFGTASLIVATGASQFHVLENLVSESDIDWSRITGFHLDEYIGLSADHPASFCKYLNDRFVSKVPLRAFHFLRGDGDIHATIDRIGDLLRERTIDVALVGIGENGHLAFNDPPANFETEQPYLIVDLDEACRQQQVGEGWFASIDDVPKQAISMSVRQILKAKAIYCSVPDERKSDAVRDTVEGPLSPLVPASILRTHPNTTLVIDRAASKKLRHQTLEASMVLS
jgi:glucosamine-6-phosphate deaminase